ncbi:carbohydrate binding family 9 domain-containing protein [Marivirga sp. S37H4]|uniref:Carbohydrate binding family 9 domain-containing protein n=1 Tax=Marivirga aurantiaca TaxID=2802615 RepID=A0A934WZC3_9BACT|nr:DUF5916 domain-containing protein [Marivirga aurantiaca]MBK6265667.1 carbohydrate binding family 9 domain-containing protein [Marivirga aurantiaca]
MKKYYLSLLIVVVSLEIKAQSADSIPRKNITIQKIINAPKIDGILDDEVWKNAPIATDFVERMPNNGVPAPDSLQTEVKILYDDLGIYFGASMKDPHPEKIMKELTQRDNIGADDFFFILLNGYNDRQQSMQFIVTAAGVQYDAKMTNGDEDNSWDAVWYSEVKINDDSWVAEIFIPYFALRFPNKKIQEWGLNMEREFHRTRSRYSWSWVDNTKGSFSIYDGELHGIENIKTPTRLSFQPYVSSYINNYDGKTNLNINGGMDLKYGINDAFTLDMVLIPDFGQARFDETVLNLSAFEVQFAEQRQFFNEGTELFSKGDMFYSRRVGGAPSSRATVSESEEIVWNPPTVDLINAMKISGRTDKGLGIGFFNAVTEQAHTEIRNIETGEIRSELVEPYANYNVLVLDQRYGDNSSVSLVNTNTTRAGNFRDANATGLYLSHTNKANTWNYRASTEGSWVLQENVKFGTEVQAGISKISGKNRVEAGLDLRTLDYDINDLGFSTTTNYVRYFGYYGYRYLQPKGFLNNMFLNFNLRHDRRLEPDLFSMNLFNFNSSFTTKNFFNFGGGFETTFTGKNDIYEPRVNGRHVKVPGYYDQWLWFSTDYRKPFAIETVVDWYKYDEKNRSLVVTEIKPRYRFSDKFNMNYNASYIVSSKEQGFVDFDEEDIIFGQRTRTTVINSIGGNYIFNNKISLNLAFRHYFSEAFYTQLYHLEENGDLTAEPERENIYDVTYNTWNLDLRFSWWFAPGSQITILYRNAMDSYVEQSRQTFNENFNYLFSHPQVNSLSFRLSYFLDYNRIRQGFNSLAFTDNPEKNRKMGKPNRI